MLCAVGIFLGLIVAFYALVHTPRAQGDWFEPYLAWIARTTGGIVGFFGQTTIVEHTTIDAEAFSMRIVRGCDAIEPTAALAAAIIASPVAWWTKVPGILCGALVLFVMNLVRLVSLFFIGVYAPKLLDILHEDVWQVIFIGLAICLWAIWVQWATRRDPKAKHVAS